MSEGMVPPASEGAGAPPQAGAQGAQGDASINPKLEQRLSEENAARRLDQAAVLILSSRKRGVLTRILRPQIPRIRRIRRGQFWLRSVPSLDRTILDLCRQEIRLQGDLRALACATVA